MRICSNCILTSSSSSSLWPSSTSSPRPRPHLYDHLRRHLCDNLWHPLISIQKGFAFLLGQPKLSNWFEFWEKRQESYSFSQNVFDFPSLEWFIWWWSGRNIKLHRRNKFVKDTAWSKYIGVSLKSYSVSQGRGWYFVTTIIFPCYQWHPF